MGDDWPTHPTALPSASEGLRGAGVLMQNLPHKGAEECFSNRLLIFGCRYKKGSR